jgi:hypothetical protein
MDADNDSDEDLQAFKEKRKYCGSLPAGGSLR